MKLQPDSSPAQFTISAQGPGFVTVNGVRYEHGICVGSDMPPEAWGQDGFAALTESHFARLIKNQAEIVIVGTGNRQQLPKPGVLRVLMEHGIGFEIMNTAAACRTYNILAAEGRKVVAGLLIDPLPHTPIAVRGDDL
ncbi:MAG: Mth938-like domain-containing protein [Betaproteobacteria bacterium]|nr:Mth938-like domain-containing protein [Betaproteobacteria bacterium]MDE2123716.1 Mth938-like domain-containing protein [Betaproteobacteria bacterium]MDE2187628.1 Mth938-like domain-containing protein [Betaproteobacteria bacterium]MDE2324155.1 Mth938-like domain-containing protein [Betaproteobacteria bacterium]